MKPTRLETLTKNPESAISLVCSTIEQLEKTNEEIAIEKDKNEQMIIEIQKTNTALSDLGNSNAKIISNFKKLLQ